MSSSSSRKAFAIIAVLFLLLSTGFSRELIGSTTTGDSFASPPSLFQESGGIARELTEDYEDAGPNTNKRSGFILPSPDPVAPAPQP
ncbi:hypothetical protein L1887_36579 [Cichorium endivia]|nr:hypothetical protein L1887_36579 [Cichorium endivia]